jgi:hypothetical protein
MEAVILTTFIISYHGEVPPAFPCNEQNSSQLQNDASIFPWLLTYALDAPKTNT